MEKIPVKSDQEEKQRLQKLKTKLDFSPYVFIMGPSGIGKSTLILEKLQPYYAKRLSIPIGACSAIPNSP